MRSQKTESSPIKTLMQPVAVGAGIGAVACCLLLLLMAALLLTQTAPLTLVGPLALVAATLGAFVSGFFAGRLGGKRGWLLGLLAAAALFFLLALAGGLALLTDPKSAHTLAKVSAMLLAGAAGGMLGVNTRR